MAQSHSQSPDLAPITRHLRAMYSSRMLVAAVQHLNVFDHVGDEPVSLAEFQRRTGLRERPAMVLVPALCAMGMLRSAAPGMLARTELGRALATGTAPSLAHYVGLEANDPGVQEMAQRLKDDGPRNTDEGTAYVKEGKEPSPMDDPDAARFFTLALAGRATYLSPIVAAALPASNGHLLDIAGGTGMFAFEWLRANPQATATVLDRPHVLAVAAEFLDEFVQSDRLGAQSVQERVTLLPGDMLEDTLPRADVVLAASLFHDWPSDTCQLLAHRFAAALNPGGELWVHDAFLDDALDGPLAVADYSAQLFWFTKGRAYSRQEYQTWLSAAGLVPTERDIATRLDYGLISARNV